MAVDLRSTFFSGSDFARTATYTPRTGVAYSLPVIFDSNYQEVDPETQVSVMSRQPQIRCIEADLQTTPGPGDHLTIDSIAYRVREFHPDGTGTAVILLTRE
jgi:hypothetical protein